MPALTLDQVKDFETYKALLKKDTMLTVPQPKKFFFAPAYTFPNAGKAVPLLLLDPADKVKTTLEKSLPGKKFKLAGKYTTGKKDGESQVFFVNVKHAAFIKKKIGAVDQALKARIHLPEGVAETDEEPASDPVDDVENGESSETQVQPKPVIGSAMQRKLDLANKEFEAKRGEEKRGPTTLPEIRARAMGQPTPPKPPAPATPPQAPAPQNAPQRTSLFGGKPPAPSQPKPSSAQVDYERRRSKVEAAITKLPKGHAEIDPLKKALAEAAENANAGNYKAAYRELKAVKRVAKRAVNGYVKTLSIDEVGKQVDQLATKVDEVIGLLNGAIKTIRDATATIAKSPKASSFATIEEAFTFRRDFTQIEAELRSLVIGTDGIVGRVCAFANTTDVFAIANDLARQIELLRANTKDQKGVAAVSTKLVETLAKYKAGGAKLTGSGARTAVAAEEAIFEKRLLEWKDLGKYQDRTPTPEQARFSEFVAKEEARLSKAKEEMRRQSEGDRVLNVTEEKAREVKVLRRFDPDDFVDDVIEEPLPAKPSKEQIDALALKAEQKIKDLLKSEKTNSDIVFDLTLKTKAEIAGDLALGAGLNLDDCTPEHRQIIEAMAERMHKRINEDLANKASKKKITLETKMGPIDAAEEIALNGSKYINPKYLGQGGMGTVIRYEDANQRGKYVVVKSLSNPDPEVRDSVVKEARLHRQVMGGEEGKGHSNVVGMRGVVKGDDDSLHMVLDYEEGGDLRDFAANVKSAMENGAIPPGARAVLTQHFFKQAVDGMRYVQSQNMTHHDIKPANFLIGGDGKLKVADFGSAQVADNTQGIVPGRGIATTPVYEAPESNTTDIVTGKVDTFSLGAMLDVLGGASMVPSSGFGSAYKQGESKVSANDRLKNAMLDPDPKKRPTLEAVQFSSLLNDINQNYPPEAIHELVKATMEYSSKVGGRITELQNDIEYGRKELAAQEEKRKISARSEQSTINSHIERAKQRIAEAEKKIAQVNEEPEVKKAYLALQKISASFK